MTPKQKPRTTKTQRKGTGPSEIAPGVFVGGWNDSVGFKGARFCVLDEAPEGLGDAQHVAIFDPEKGRAIPENLDGLAKAMGAARGRGEPVIVYCGHGIRRGPLGGAWYLHQAEGLSLDEAFDRVTAARPGVERPREWIDDPGNLESR